MSQRKPPDPQVKITKKTAQGYLYAKVDEFVTVTDIKGTPYPSYKHMEQDFKKWLWGTKRSPKP